MGLLDFFKFAAPTRTPTTTNSLTSRTHLTSWTDIKDLGLNVNRRELRKMYHDDEICAATDTRKDACTSTPWNITGDDETLNAELLEIFTPLLSPVLDYSWWSVPYGYAVIQVVWLDKDGTLIPNQIIDMPFESFSIKDGKPYYANTIQQQPVDGKYFATVRNPTSECQNGQALYQRLYTAYYYRLNAWEFWIQNLETFGKPFMHAKTETNDPVTTDFLKSLVGAKRPRGIITDKDTDVSVVEASGSSNTSFKDFEMALSQRIQRLILGQTLTSGAGDVGSQALGTVHNQVRDDKRVADCKLLEKTVQAIIDFYLFINGREDEKAYFQFQHTKSLNKELAERDNLLLTQGVQHTEKYYEENYDFDAEDFILGEPRTPTQSGTAPATGATKATNTKGYGFATKQKIVEAQIKTEESAISNSEFIFTPEELQAAIKKSKTKKDLIKNLAILMGKDSAKFENDVTKGLLMSNVEGFDHGTQGD